MSDIRLAVAPFLDVSVEGNDLALDTGLETAVILSVFLDARAPVQDTLENDPRGWWGDEFGEVPMGSHLWRLRRERTTPATAREIERVCKKALDWMIAFRLADSIEVSASFEKNVLSLEFAIKRPGENERRGKYSLNWEQYGMAA